MNDDVTRKSEPADAYAYAYADAEAEAEADTATDAVPAPAGTSILHEIGRTALLSLAATPAPVLVAVADWWLKTH
ncbi:hypothetical protein [Kitasatospora sp. NPDC059599]|uniref:hypothetical protein n=1 Tax=Kitasatospora sp. NPDC059599 TaxID=3346880 RepID=UPI00368C29C1